MPTVIAAALMTYVVASVAITATLLATGLVLAPRNDATPTMLIR